MHSFSLDHTYEATPKSPPQERQKNSRPKEEICCVDYHAFVRSVQYDDSVSPFPMRRVVPSCSFHESIHLLHPYNPGVVLLTPIPTLSSRPRPPSFPFVYELTSYGVRLLPIICRLEIRRRGPK